MRWPSKKCTRPDGQDELRYRREGATQRSATEFRQTVQATVQGVAANADASLRKYFAILRNDLKALSTDQLRKLIMVVETDLGRTLLTRLDQVADMATN